MQNKISVLLLQASKNITMWKENISFRFKCSKVEMYNNKPLYIPTPPQNVSFTTLLKKGQYSENMQFYCWYFTHLLSMLLYAFSTKDSNAILLW